MKLKTKNIKPSLQPYSVDGKVDWNGWLAEFETNLKKLGYKRYVQCHQHEDFAYWKTFRIGKKKIYQVGLLFYDFRQYAIRDPMANKISVQYECMLKYNYRIDLSVSMEIDVSEFEQIAKDFYTAMSKYCITA